MRWIWAILLAGLCGVNAGAQTAVNTVTVVMRDGKVVEGIFRGSTETEVSIEVAGQLLKIPLLTVKYVSLVGRIDVPADAAPPSVSPDSLGAAVAGLRDIHTATEIGVLR